MKYIFINRGNGVVTMVRSEVTEVGESELTEHEKIINELYNYIKETIDITNHMVGEIKALN